MNKTAWIMISLAIVIAIIFGLLVVNDVLVPVGGIIPRKRTSIDRDITRVMDLHGITLGIMYYCATKKKFPASHGNTSDERISNLFTDVGPEFLPASFLNEATGTSRLDFQSNTPYSGIIEVELESTEKTKDYYQLQDLLNKQKSIPECTGSRYCRLISCEEDLKK